MIKFTKMEGIGNDYIYINCLEQTIPEERISEMTIKMSDRHFGIGSDGLVLICSSEKCDFKMRMFNSLDGKEAEMCGNAIRCVGKYVYDKKLINKDEITIETLAGTKILKLNIENEKVKTVTVDMGEPILKAEQIPVQSKREKVINEKINIDNVDYNVTCVSVGNPHCIVFMDEIKDLKIEKIGPKFEKADIFPKKINTEFVKIIDRENVEMRVWERGAGETLACGTGASAVTVACVLNNLTERKIKVNLLGGILELEWSKENNHIYMTGPAKIVFEGEMNCELY